MRKRGISLIVLIITIIVVIILAAVVILTISKNNPIESAKEARFKEDVRTFQDELALYISKQYATAGGHWDGSISAKSYNEIVEYIPSFTKKYEGKFVINNNNLEYTNKVDEKEKEYAQSLNVKEKQKLLPAEYQQVEYLESTGTQYIDTNYICNENTELEIEYNLTTNPSQFCSVIYSGQSGWVYSAIGIDCYQGNLQPQIGDFRVKIPSNDFTRNIVYISKDKIIVNNLITMREQTLTYNRPTTDKGMSIFASTWSNNSSIYYLSMNLYKLKIYTNGVLKRNFIPCYSTTTVIDANGNHCSSGTKGLYDLVEGKFYTNQGTGEDFIPGLDVD